MSEAKHELNQEANDWIMCKCGRIFSKSKTKTKWDKFNKHLEEEKE
jgi:hypothetical protein